MEMAILPEHEGQRLDRLLAILLPEFSRSRLQKLIGDGQIRVNGRSVRSSYKVTRGEQVLIEVPPPEPVAIGPEEIPLDVFFEDEHLLVVNKPVGMMVHPAGSVQSGTLVNALLAHCDQLSGINGQLRPGIVHRLDKDTSGLLMVAKDEVSHRGLAGQLEKRTVLRQYRAVVWGHFEGPEGRIEAAIGRHRKDRKRMVVDEVGRFAATRYEVDTTYDFLSLLSLRLETGRTHQIRVHMAYAKHPVFGDDMYGGREIRLKGISPMYRNAARRLLQGATRQMLHAASLGFDHPVTGEPLVFQSDVPQDMQLLLDALNG
ncbi:MAG: RluA family pseudouridine synthase [bacterium]|nr:RluA family pseudouridine synthase [bacterium]